MHHPAPFSALPESSVLGTRPPSSGENLQHIQQEHNMRNLYWKTLTTTTKVDFNEDWEPDMYTIWLRGFVLTSSEQDVDVGTIDWCSQ